MIIKHRNNYFNNQKYNKDGKRGFVWCFNLMINSETFKYAYLMNRK